MQTAIIDTWFDPVTNLRYKAGITYSMDQDAIIRAAAAGATKDDHAMALLKDAGGKSAVNKALKAASQDEVTAASEKTASTKAAAKRIKTLEDQVESHEAALTSARAELSDAEAKIQTFIDGWNDGVDEGAQAETLADCLAAVQLMKEQAAAGE